MPELPEVETVRRTLTQLVEGKTIREVRVYLDRIIREPKDPKEFSERMKGQTIRSIKRRGKFLRFLMEDWVLVSHLRMEGRYGLYRFGDPVEKHTHVVFSFTDGTELRYKDVRQFGTMHLFERDTDLLRPPLSRLGLEPLDEDFTLDAFKGMLAGRKTKIKPFLLNQECIAGLGNIYVDESLFQAGIHPARDVSSLKGTEIKRLYDSIVDTLKRAVELGGSSVKSYVNSLGEMGLFQLQLNVYGRKGEPCKTCGSSIERMIVGGRGTHYCPVCQPLKQKVKST